MSIVKNIQSIISELPSHVTLVAISKTHPPSDIMEAYQTGHKVFGENKVQELVDKYEKLPKDIEWHMVGHLQTNKVKYIAPFVKLIHSVDSLKLLKEIDKAANKNGRVIDCLLQMHIAKEETKFGLSANEMVELLSSNDFKSNSNARVVGLMGMATFTENMEQVRDEFRYIANFFKEIKNKFFFNSTHFKVLSIGMSGDYSIAVEGGSTMVRIGSNIFGERTYGTN
jgi:PLP dependent protein